MLTKQYLIGFIEGEGCFQIQKIKDNTYRFTMTINLKGSEEILIKKIKKGFLNTGKIYKYDHHDYPSIRYVIYSLPDIIWLINFLGKNPFQGNKQHAYQIWKTAAELYYNNRPHKIKNQMNDYFLQLKKAHQI